MAATPDLSKLYVSGDNRVQSIALGVPSEAQDADGVDPDGETLEGMPFDPSLLPFVCPMTALLMLTGSLLGALWTGTRTSPTPRR